MPWLSCAVPWGAGLAVWELGEDGVAVFVGDAEAGFFFEKRKAPVIAKIRTTAANARTYWLRLMEYLLL